MSKNLVIVESPAKAKTISRFLGNDYTVLASMGHIRDLPKSQMGVDTEKKFEPTYVISPDKEKTVKELKSKLGKGTTLYIATDEDREGEAIGWHLLSALGVDEKKTPVKRIVFHEITEGAIKRALDNPRKIDMKLVDAQQARRVLDRVVGYELSPVLWKKIRYGLSAGRVQSVAVRLIVEREREIEAFKSDEYWSIVTYFAKKKDKKEFVATLSKYKGKKCDIKNEEGADKILNILRESDFFVKEITDKKIKRSPAPPFTTSTLQQEASRKLNFSVKKTMVVAQKLYEGVKTHKGHTGLITYMRTDSVNLSNVALQQAQEIIEREFGKDYGLSKPRFYKGRKGAQEA
ncbi:type I DNA topoisomerase, partial [Patescibacteria group bacterium]|nr:type I DNA topoisomerase [Patescibacteria group bacterium]